MDPVRRTVGFVDQNGHSRVLSYQHCVLASGSVTEFFGIPGLAENALTLKTLGDAIRIRNRLIDLLERAALLSKEERGALLTFVVVGGGLNGTEIAGELHDFVLKEALTAGSVSAEKAVDDPRQNVQPQNKTSFALSSLPHKGAPL